MESEENLAGYAGSSPVRHRQPALRAPGRLGSPMGDMGVDGERWAQEFCRINGIRNGSMVANSGAFAHEVLHSWFANAIEAGITEGVRREKARRAEQRLAQVQAERGIGSNGGHIDV